MEDFPLIEPAFSDSVAVFAVFDGHDGAQAARYARDHVLSALRDKEEEDLWSNPVEIFTEIVRDVDTKFCQIAVGKNLYSGTTAVVAAVVRTESGDRKLVLCNVGDSQAVVGSQGRLKLATIPHSPHVERKRIEEAGGWITEELGEYGKVIYRVNGGLSMSRSIGDVEYKCKKNVYLKSADCDWSVPANYKSRHFSSDLVISTPDVIVHDITPADDFVVLASDGLWDVVSEESAVKRVAKMLKENTTAQTAADRLAQKAIKRGTFDNTTVIVVYLY
eukprot:m.186393 g.186393  ORF g.186393 m.186393 type:complete len:276 (+) comp39347_c0_seq1:159-986(+)